VAKLDQAPPPSALVWGGRSLVAFWRLDAPLAASEAADFQRDFCERLGADTDARSFPTTNTPTQHGQARPMRDVPAWHPHRRILFPGSGLWIDRQVDPAPFLAFDLTRIYRPHDLTPKEGAA
jgi:hypothetical protein